MRRKWGKGLSILLSGAMLAGSLAVQPLNVAAAPEGTEITETEMQELLANTGSSDSVISRNRVSVHDPSVTKSGDTYYVFGSHMGVASTTDLMNWTSHGAENSTGNALYGDAEGNVVTYDEAFDENAYQGKITTVIDGKEVELDFGTYDVEGWISDNTISGNMWAPDVVYNPTMGKWCMYYSLNGAKWNSSIVLLTADEVEGPYCYQGPVVFTGFSTAGSSKSFKNTDIELVLGEMDELPAKYQQISDTSNGNWGTWWPHAIDPSVFYDEEGKLWMAYGSWSGGIAMLELDEETGLRDYTVTYESDSETLGKSWTSDAYFGKKIAGGYYVSGEGPYIEQIGDYYYLFMSYGFYSPEGGYEMRVFRSENPDGPYVDADGTNAIFERYVMNYGANGDTRGEKLMGNYKWATMSVAEVAQGHNSAIVDEDGNAYVIYHTKFADGTVSHEVRVHQLFVNEAGWLVAAPYEYSGEELSDTGYTTEQVVGEYDVIVHEYAQDYANLGYESPKQIALNADGTITGAYTGTWTGSATEPNITLEIADHTYTGVLLEQNVDNTPETVLCFTVCGDQGLCIWGSKQMDAKSVIAYNVSSFDFGVPERAWESFTLPTEGSSAAAITWSSSNADVLAADGTIKTAVTENTEVILTATISKGDYYYNMEFPVMVMAGDGTYAEKTLIASYFTDAPQELSGKNDGSLSVANPFYDGASKGLDITSGVSIEFDVTAGESANVLAALLGFTGGGGKLYFTEGSYLGYNGTGGWFDANLDKQDTGYFLAEDYIGESAHVAINFTSEGFEVYVNEELAYDQSNLETETGDAGTFSNYNNILKWLGKTADTLSFGSGAWWTDQSATASISNVECYVAAYEEASNADSIIYYEKEEVVIEADDTCIEEENPFYGLDTDTFYMEYTINFADTAAMNGWDGVFSFYDSASTGRISMQANPYICFNDMAGTWVDINWPDNTESDDWVTTAQKGQDYRITVLVTEDTTRITVDGKELAHSINGDAANRDLLDYLKQCDKLTWGVGVDGTAGKTAFWNSEICTLKDIVISNYENVGVIAKDEVKLSSTSFIEKVDNPFYNTDLIRVEMEYTLNIDSSAAKNGWDGIFSFYNSETGGRVSMQTNPYLCYNIDVDGEEEWLDVNGPNDGGTNWASGTAVTGQDYKFNVVITKDEITIAIDGEPIELSENGVNGTIDRLLSYIGECDQFTWGVGLAQTSYWWTELSTISDATIMAAYNEIPVEGIALDNTELTLVESQEGTLTAVFTPDNATNQTVTWSSSDETVATVADGKVTAVAAGTATITATSANGKTAACIVTVTGRVKSEKVELDKTELALVEGDKATLTATISPEDTTDKTLTWSSSDEGVATVTNGTVKAVKAGTATITVTTADGSTASCTVTVEAKAVAVEKVALDKTELTLVAGEEGTLTASITPEDATDKALTWSTSDEAVATVDEEGVVTAVAAGTATITVTTANGFTATCTVAVEEAVKLVITDIDESHWGYTFVTAIAEQKIMNGVHTNEDGSIEFAPNDKLTREMVAQILYNAEGTPEITTENAFTDVVAGAWYEKAVIWAAENGIVSGYPDGTFGVAKNITRQEIATMLRNYATCKKYDTTASGDLSSFADVTAVDSWATENMSWAVGNSIITGKAGNLLDPKGDATRAEAATMIYKFNNAFKSAE